MEQVKDALRAVSVLAIALERNLSLELDEYEWCVDTLVALLEECNDELKPVVEEVERARKG